MYEESNANDCWEVHVTCDSPGCSDGTTVIMPTREETQWALYRIGWRLYRHKQVCPKHADAVARKLRKRLTGA